MRIGTHQTRYLCLSLSIYEVYLLSGANSSSRRPPQSKRCQCHDSLPTSTLSGLIDPVTGANYVQYLYGEIYVPCVALKIS